MGKIQEITIQPYLWIKTKMVSHIRYDKWLPTDMYWNAALNMKYVTRVWEYFKTITMSKMHHMEEKYASPLAIRQVQGKKEEKKRGKKGNTAINK